MGGGDLRGLRQLRGAGVGAVSPQVALADALKREGIVGLVGFAGEGQCVAADGQGLGVVAGRGDRGAVVVERERLNAAIADAADQLQHLARVADRAGLLTRARSG